ncbi:alpha-L-rhamnosidase N-terminal domain-containing protein [Haloferula rosea]|uniref:Alpha-L-rhamnosidase N-terminal domain-containing protein n=1 Tax=Haloferula rosea TaxID=490093 RepID=A0A934RDH4_9BACT|nr:alpha-L-rhamnosidase N-terminal domain-containing protein [Haloferula rosea]MBK1826581.1 alpha-L-rhamnosidase N-terminal domain-containing protein [Haloferula rosea]
MKKWILFGALTACSVMGSWAKEAPVDWKAQWIWQEEDGPDNSWVAFRKEVQITEVPDKVIASISADSKYWMWINGEMVVFEGSVARGSSPAIPWNRVKEIWTLPPETKPSNSYYEEVDITSHLNPGKNTIAVLAWYWGKETHKGTHIDSGKGGFIFQADFGDHQVISDRSWKVKADPAYALENCDAGKNIVQFSVRYDARHEMSDWISPEFSDADWNAATEKGTPPTAPWYKLEENYVPALVNHGLKDYENYPGSKFPFVSKGEIITCELPFNKQITPYLEVEADAGLEIKITTDNRLNQINAYYTTKQGKQSFESFSWMSGHTIHYDIPAGVKVLGLKYRWMSVGDIEAGSFECSDPFYERLWWMGRNTLFVCARDNFMDCPDRERACWIGDVADQASYLFYCMDDAGRQLLKKAIRITMAYSHEGVYGALGPLRLRELPTQSLQFVDQGIWQYYLNTGDKETLRDVYPYVRDYLNLWKMGADGLPKRAKRSMDSWNWSDWGQKGTVDDKVILDSLYFMALNSAKKMALELGEKQDLPWYDKRIEALQKGFNNQYWTGKFYSSNAKKFQDDRANALAILSGVARPDKHDAIVENVLIPNQFCSPHFEWMVEDAMSNAGHYGAALKRMKERYQSQVDRKGLSTLYEMFPKGGSYNHAWNAPNTILAKHMVGITPTEVGWKEYQILPNLEHFTTLKQVIPSVKGDITVDINLTDSAYRMKLISPQDTTALVGIPKTSITPKTIKVNGSVVWNDGTIVGSVVGLSPSGEDEKYLKFKVAPGTWTFSAETQNP